MLADADGDLLASFNRLRQGMAVPAAGVDSIVVAQDGRGRFNTISQAVDAARPGDTAFVSEGKYFKSVIADKNLSFV